VGAPDTGKSSVFHTHPGTTAYFDGTQESVIDQLMNQLFNVSIVGGILGSYCSSIWRERNE
jgi:hypothetical protein